MKKAIYLVLSSLLLVSCEFPWGRPTGSDVPTDTPTDSATITQTETKTDSISESQSESQNDNIVATEDYFWPFAEDDIINNTQKFGVSSMNWDSDFDLRLDGNSLKRDSATNFTSYLFYDTIGCNSDNVNNAYDCFYLNGVKLGKFKADGTKGIPFTIDQLDFGDNIFTVTIGKYWSTYEYDYNGLNQANCDDFQVGNMRLVTSTGAVIKCDKMVFYKNVKGTRTYKQYEVVPEDGKLYYVGDGYAGNPAYDGHPDAIRDIPQKIDFYISFDLPDAVSTYTLDTTTIEDGRHLLSLYDNGKLVLQNHISIDNNKPTCTCNIKNFESVNVANKKLEVTVSDASGELVESQILVDGIDINDKEAEEPFDFSKLSNGMHNIHIYALDKVGNALHEVVNFFAVNSQYNDNANKALTMKEVNSSATSKEYEVTTDGASEVTLKLNASSQDNELINLSAFNPISGEYEIIARGVSGSDINITVPTANYAYGGKMTIKAEAQYFGNGSNKIYWVSDTQYLPKTAFTDINPYYEKLMNYYKDGISKGDAAYLVHTGDIVDDHPGYKEAAELEWSYASKAFEILDKANIPYGTCAGNHDVGSTIDAIDYIYYSKYFGNFRNNQALYLGGVLNDNQCHYDLISVGKYDFVFLYIGFGIEYKQEVIDWCNAVLKMYPHRNAIVCTHAYLSSNGDLDDQTQAQIIHDEIIVPNDNVKFLFCGHTDGSAHNKKTENGHTFYEILNCYQFVEKDTYRIDHNINGYKCNGEGYMKDVTFNDDGSVSFKTYSPIKNKQNPLGATDSFTYNDVDLMVSNHSLTINSLLAYK